MVTRCKCVREMSFSLLTFFLSFSFFFFFLFKEHCDAIILKAVSRAARETTDRHTGEVKWIWHTCDCKCDRELGRELKPETERLHLSPHARGECETFRCEIFVSLEKLKRYIVCIYTKWPSINKEYLNDGLSEKYLRDRFSWRKFNGIF